jgi:hypothetical protein
MPAAAVSSTSLACAKCETAFAPKREAQRFCSRSCQKHSSRGPRGAAHSAETRARNRVHYDRATWLCYDLHRMPRGRRLGFIAELIEAAREHDGQLRVILTDPKLLGADPHSGIGKQYPDSMNQEVKNIAKAADAYCRAFWGHGVRDVVYKRCVEPPTGEGERTEGHSLMPISETLRIAKVGLRGAPEGFDYRANLGPVCKGWRWLSVGRAEAVKLRALGGCPTPMAENRPRTIEGKPSGTFGGHRPGNTVSAAPNHVAPQPHIPLGQPEATQLR